MTDAGPFGVLGPLDVPLGLGLLRLGTEGRPDESAAVALIHRALDHGIRVLDTAPSYGLDDSDFHYGEKLARSAIETWAGSRADVRIVTKVGMSRPKGRWVANGKPAHLRESVDGSLAALGVDSLFLLLLHANDPASPFEDALATLAALQREGKVQHLGLCNVDLAEIRQAQRHFTVAAIQNELSVIDRHSATDGTLALAKELGIPFLAHRPLGGHAKVDNLKKNRAVKPLADRHGVTPHEAALATLLDLGPPVIALVGATRLESLDSSLRALQVRLDGADREALAARISFEPTAAARAALVPQAIPMNLPTLRKGEGPGAEPEVVIILGVQGAGKSSLAMTYVAAGYDRLNRDVLGGNLADLIPTLAAHLAAGQRRVVLDNTYATRVSRYPIIRAAHAAGVRVRCVYLATPLREALINVVLRTLERHGRLLGPDDLKELGTKEPNLPPPSALTRWLACFEPPQLDEGFSVVDEIAFVRQPGPLSGTAKGVLLDVDGTLRRTKSGEKFPLNPDDIEILPGRHEKLARLVNDGYQLFFVSNQSGVASGTTTLENVRACFERTRDLLQVPIMEVAFCPHPAFPVGCYCRKPLPGLGVYLAWKHQLALNELLMVGDMDSDGQFAVSLGASYARAESFFAG
jgi:histidinol-phosphate phosphatase family protein